jgi:hypothetical protein
MRRGLPISVARALHAAGEAALPQIEELEAATPEQLRMLRDAVRRANRERKSRPGLAVGEAARPGQSEGRARV